MQDLFSKVKEIIIAHRPLFLIFIIFLILSYVASFSLKYNSIIFAGEYIFSFDYYTHIQNIISDYHSGIAERLDNANCFDCPDFYHYSRWYSLFKIGYHGISQLLHIHPFVFLIFSMIITQLVSLYIFTRNVIGKFSWVPFLVASFIFILYPYKYSLLVETHDGLIYSNIILYITILFISLKRFSHLPKNSILAHSLITGLIVSFFLNVNIAVLPIVVYLTLAFFVFYFKEISKAKDKFLGYLLLLSMPVVLINFPLFQSFLQYGNTRHYEGYISFSLIDSFMAGLSLANTNVYITVGFILLLLWSYWFANIPQRLKIILGIGYIIIGILILGKNSPINIYHFVFNYIPLFDSLRATYRLMFFELLLIFLFLYLALLRLRTDKNKIVYVIICIFCIVLPTIHIINERDYIYKAELPHEYFEIQTYVNNLSGKKIYFPHSLPLFHDITTDYYWSPKYSETIILYKNPFTSLLPIRDLIQFERYPYLLSPELLELRYLTDFDKPVEEIIKSLEYRGVEYIIFDNNYRWKENFPNFDKNRLISLTKKLKESNNIVVLQLSNQKDKCKSGYGKIQYDFCTDLSNPKTLLGKSYSEYVLEVFPEKYGRLLRMRKNATYTKSILDPHVQKIFINKSIFFDRDIMHVFGQQGNVFQSDILPGGTYKLFFQIFKAREHQKLFNEAIVNVNVDKLMVHSIVPHAECDDLYWEEITVTVTDGGRISVDIANPGYVILGSLPILVTEDKATALQISEKDCSIATK